MLQNIFSSSLISLSSSSSSAKQKRQHLTLKAPPIICSRRRLQILPLFQKQQIRHDISWESSAGRRFSCNIIPYFCRKIGKDVAKFVVRCSCDWRFNIFRCQAPQKTNTSVPRMFQGLLNFEGLWLQHRVSPEPFNLLLWNFHRMLLIYKTFIWTNKKKIVTWPLAAILGAILKIWKMPINNFFMQK